MLFKSIKIIITTIFFLASIQSAFSNELIIPIKKPSKSINENNKKISSNIIIPQKKPTSEKKEKKKILISLFQKKELLKLMG